MFLMVVVEDVVVVVLAVVTIITASVAHKRPRHLAKSAGGRLHLNMHTPSIQ